MRLPALTAASSNFTGRCALGGLDEVQLAERLGWPMMKIGLIFDGYHAARLEQLEAAFAARPRLIRASVPA